MPYSAVTQPSPLPRRNGGTRSSTEAVTSTRVSPKLTSTDPSACFVKPGSMVIARIWSAARPEGRILAQSLFMETSAHRLASEGCHEDCPDDLCRGGDGHGFAVDRAGQRLGPLAAGKLHGWPSRMDLVGRRPD